MRYQLFRFGCTEKESWSSSRTLFRLKLGNKAVNLLNLIFLVQGKEGNLEVAGEAKLDAKMRKLSRMMWIPQQLLRKLYVIRVQMSVLQDLTYADWIPPEPEPLLSIYSELHNYADESQIVALASLAYRAAILNAQPTSVPNPADNAAYYDIQNGAVPVVPVPGTIGSSNLQTASGHLNYDLLFVGQIGQADAVARKSSLSKQFVDPLVPGFRSDTTPIPVVSTLVASAPVTKPPKEYASVTSYKAIATSATDTSTSVAVSKGKYSLHNDYLMVSMVMLADSY